MASTAFQAILWWAGLCILSVVLGLYVLWLGRRTASGAYDDTDSNDSTMHLHLHEDIRHFEYSMNAARALFGDLGSIDQMKCDLEKAAAFGWTRWFEMKKRIRRIERRIENLEESLETKK